PGGERESGRGTEAHRGPGLAGEFRAVDAPPGPGLEGEPRSCRDTRLDAELSHVAIEDPLRAEERPAEGAHGHRESGTETNGAHPTDDRTERARHPEPCGDPVLGEGPAPRDGPLAVLRRGRSSPQDRPARA